MAQNGKDIALDTFVTKRRELLALANAVIGNKAIAEEIVQESWVLWNSKNYPGDRAAPIFKRIVLNLAKDLYRRQKREWACFKAHALTQDSVPDSERTYAARQTLTQVVDALHELPDRTLAAFRMHRLEGLTYVQIADRLEVVPSRAHQLVCNALVHLALHVDE